MGRQRSGDAARRVAPILLRFIGTERGRAAIEAYLDALGADAVRGLAQKSGVAQRYLVRSGRLDRDALRMVALTSTDTVAAVLAGRSVLADEPGMVRALLGARSPRVRAEAMMRAPFVHVEQFARRSLLDRRRTVRQTAQAALAAGGIDPAAIYREWLSPTVHVRARSRAWPSRTDGAPGPRSNGWAPIPTRGSVGPPSAPRRTPDSTRAGGVCGLEAGRPRPWDGAGGRATGSPRRRRHE
jgi:hypothetical protein